MLVSWKRLGFCAVDTVDRGSNLGRSLLNVQTCYPATQPQSPGEERDVLPVLTPVRLGRKDLFSCDFRAGALDGQRDSPTPEVQKESARAVQCVFQISFLKHEISALWL